MCTASKRIFSGLSEIVCFKMSRTSERPQERLIKCKRPFIQSILSSKKATESPMAWGNTLPWQVWRQSTVTKHHSNSQHGQLIIRSVLLSWPHYSEDMNSILISTINNCHIDMFQRTPSSCNMRQAGHPGHEKMVQF